MKILVERKISSRISIVQVSSFSLHFWNITLYQRIETKHRYLGEYGEEENLKSLELSTEMFSSLAKNRSHLPSKSIEKIGAQRVERGCCLTP